jgi:magnesium transporter
MKTIYQSTTDGLTTLQSHQDGAWINLVNPTEAEFQDIASRYAIDLDDLRAPLDAEERSRVSVEDNYTLILVDVPTTEKRNDKDWYITIPLGIIVTDQVIITTCLEETGILEDFKVGRIKNFNASLKTRFIFQMLYKNSQVYLKYLRYIDRKSDEIERQLHSATRNSELIELLELEKSLVYFTTSLTTNERVLEKLVKLESIKKYPEDDDLLEDTIVENQQAIEMAQIYSNITSGMMDAFASIISNNQNDIMKTLALITIVMSIPTMIFSAYGMNVASSGMPLADSHYGFWIVTIVSLVLSAFATIFFLRKKWF